MAHFRVTYEEMQRSLPRFVLVLGIGVLCAIVVCREFGVAQRLAEKEFWRLQAIKWCGLCAIKYELCHGRAPRAFDDILAADIARPSVQNDLYCDLPGVGQMLFRLTDARHLVFHGQSPELPAASQPGRAVDRSSHAVTEPFMEYDDRPLSDREGRLVRDCVRACGQLLEAKAATNWINSFADWIQDCDSLKDEPGPEGAVGGL